MELMKRVADGCYVILRITHGIDGNRQGKVLTCVPHFEKMKHADINWPYSPARQHLHLGGNPSQLAKVCSIQGAIVCTHKIVPRLGQQHSAGRKLTGKIRDHYKRNMQGSCNLSRMKRTSAA